MAKARGNKLVPPANYTRNPMSFNPQNQGPVQPFVNQTNNDLEGYIQYAESYGQPPLFSGASDSRVYRNLLGVPQVFGGSTAPVANRTPVPLVVGNPANQGPVQPMFADLNSPEDDVQRYIKYAESYGQSPRLIFGRGPAPGGSTAPVAGRPSPRATYRGEPLGPNPLGEQVREMIDRTNPSVRVRPGLLDEPIPPALTGIPQRTTPSVNIWNGGTMQRSPSPMTYADPSTDPNRGMYDLARSIDAIRERSQIKFPSNPMSPTFGVVDPAAESARRLAPMLAQDAARQQNTPMNGMAAYEADPTRYRPGDPAIQARQLDNAQRVTSGRLMDRTRSNPMADQINAQANAVASGRGWYLGGQFVGATGNPQWGTAENMRRRVELNNAPQQATQENRESARARRKGIHNQFMEENNGMNYLQARRAERQAGLKERSFKKAVTRGLNPMSPEAQALFPEQVAKLKGQPLVQVGRNPMARGRTLEDQQAAAADITEREATSPHIAGLGVEPGSGLAGLNQKVSARILEDPNAEFSDESLKEFQQHAAQYDTIATDQNDPFAFGTGPYGMDRGLESKQAALWKELAELPDNPRSRADWLKKYKSIKPDVEPDLADPANQQPSPFQSPEKPTYRGGNPMYTPRLPIRTGV